MAGSLKYEKLSDTVRRTIDLAVAVGREKLLDTHVQHALELVDRARPTVAPLRAISIYLRLHSLGEPDAQILSHRVLVELGQRAMGESKRDAEAADDESADDTPWDTEQALAQRIRKRLRGRVNKDLRRWVELHTGRTEVALLDVHVDNALRFVEILQPENSYGGVVEMYTRLFNVPNPWADMIYLFTLHRLSAPGPDPGNGASAPQPATAEPEAVPASRALRVIENTG